MTNNIAEFSDAWMESISLSEENAFDKMDIVCVVTGHKSECPCFKRSEKLGNECEFFKVESPVYYGGFKCKCPAVKKYWLDVMKDKVDKLYAKESLLFTLNDIN